MHMAGYTLLLVVAYPVWGVLLFLDIDSRKEREKYSSIKHMVVELGYSHHQQRVFL
jgi:hypothetical protein